jgi:hypothetical protein
MQSQAACVGSVVVEKKGRKARKCIDYLMSYERWTQKSAERSICDYVATLPRTSIVMFAAG